LLANTLLGIWWVDPVVALGIAALAFFEGRRAWRRESCGCTTCAAGKLG
jgi:divalent metal cation (Fe/Co/Zn/Cd) transporter